MIWRKITLIFCLLLYVASISAQSANETLLKIQFRPIESGEIGLNKYPLEYVKSLAYMMENYCDSTTASYNELLMEKTIEAQSFIETQNNDELHASLFMGILNIYFSGTLSEQQEHKCEKLLSYYIIEFYPDLHEEDKEIYRNILLMSYINETSGTNNISQWCNKIDCISNDIDYNSYFDLFYFLCQYLIYNNKNDDALTIAQALFRKYSIIEDSTPKYIYWCYYILGIIYYNMEDYESTISFISKAFAIYNENESLKDLDKYRDILNKFANSYYRNGEYKKAHDFALQLVEAYQEKNLEYISAMQLLALTTYYTNNQDEAEKILVGLIEIAKDTYPECLSGIYSLLSSFHRSENENGIALYYAKMAIQQCNMDDIKANNNELWYCNLLANIAKIYLELNDTESSIRVIMQAFSIIDKIKYKYDLYDIYGTVILLNGTYLKNCLLMGDTERATNIWNTILTQANKHYKNKATNSQYINLMSIPADIARIKGNNKEALAIYESMMSNIDLENNENAYYLGLLSDYQLTAGEVKKASINSLRAYNITKDIKFLFINTDCNLALKKVTTVKKNLHEIFSISKKQVISNFLRLNDIQRRSYWWGINNWYQNRMPEIILNLGDTDKSLNRLLYDATLLSKGALLSTTSDFRKYISQSDDEKIKDMYRQFLTMEQDSFMVGDYKDYTLLAKRSQIESSLLDFYASQNPTIKQLSVSSINIQQNLKKNEVAIEFISPIIDSTKVDYYALILTNKGEPEFIKLCSNNDIHKYTNAKYYNKKYNLKKLGEHIWKPLMSFLKNKKKIYFSTTGELNNIPIEYLPNIYGDGYICDSIQLFRLSSTREIISINTIKNRSAVLFGGIDYNSKTLTTDNVEPKLYSENIPQILPKGINRDNVDYLPGTKAEVESIDSIMHTFRYSSVVYDGTCGTEKQFKKLSYNSPSIIHIATHGKYWSSSDEQMNSNKYKYAFIKENEYDTPYVEDNVLSHSYLMFSGANLALKEDSLIYADDDGILTAEEITKLDFNGVDLVVLSACQTGLGDVKDDGVFGLQRGFKIAGVKSLLMSLWPVDDDATQLLMTEFYKNLLKGKSKHESLRLAQIHVKNFTGLIKETYRDFSNPQYWAAFILLDALN